MCFVLDSTILSVLRHYTYLMCLVLSCLVLSCLDKHSCVLPHFSLSSPNEALHRTIISPVSYLIPCLNHPLTLSPFPFLPQHYTYTYTHTYSIVQQTVLGAAAIDGGVYSEPIMYLKMIIAWHSTPHGEQEEWASRHGIIR